MPTEAYWGTYVLFLLRLFCIRYLFSSSILGIIETAYLQRICWYMEICKRNSHRTKIFEWNCLLSEPLRDEDWNQPWSGLLGLCEGSLGERPVMEGWELANVRGQTKDERKGSSLEGLFTLPGEDSLLFFPLPCITYYYVAL